MKLSKRPPCTICEKAPLAPFYVARVSLAFFSPAAADGVLGVARILGGSRAAMITAEALAPDADVVKIAGEEDPSLWSELAVCMDCATTRGVELAHLVELEQGRKSEASRRDLRIPGGGSAS